MQGIDSSSPRSCGIAGSLLELSAPTRRSLENEVFDGGQKMEKLSKGVLYDVEDGKLMLEIDITSKGEVSNSGKSMVIASTSGNLSVPGTDGGVLGLNFYRKR